MDKIKVKLDSMDMTSADNILKPALSSTKSIDEGFESDPDRELSNAETDTNQLPPGSVVVQSQAFDVLQTTDRDGVQHTQITRRPLHSEFPGHKPFESGTLSASDNLRRNNKEHEKNRIVYTNPTVSIPRAGAGNQRIITTNGSIQSSQLGHLTPNHLQYSSSMANSSTIVDQHNHRHRLVATKAHEMGGNSRLAKSTELMLRSGNATRDRMNFPNAMNDNLSQVALINGKLICVNMPVTQIIPAASIPSAAASSLANASHNQNMLHNSKRHFSNSSNNNSNIGGNSSSNHNTGIGNQAIKISNNHHQKYISNGRSSSGNDANSIAQQVNNAIIQNANSLHTFYPAEGNISLIKSQYGLKYKSTHFNGLQEQPAPISLWSQSLARQPRR